MSEVYSDAARALAEKVRLVKDFPEEGILFEDLTPVLADADAFQAVVDGLAQACKEHDRRPGRPRIPAGVSRGL